MNPNLIVGNIRYIEDDLTVDQFDDELKIFASIQLMNL